MDLTATACSPGVSAGDRRNGSMLTPYVHQVSLVMSPGADLDAPGAAITLELCGSWDHTPPCPLAHHVHAERTGPIVRLRVIFATEPDNEEDVRRRIDQALSAGELTGRAVAPVRWKIEGSFAAELSSSEAARARRLAGQSWPC